MLLLSGSTWAWPSSGGWRFAILGFPRVDGPLTEQITLPLRHVGLGLTHIIPAHTKAAYLAAAATTHRVMRKGHETFRALDGPSAGELRLQWEVLHGGADGL
jgi:hypothetical protein